MKKSYIILSIIMYSVCKTLFYYLCHVSLNVKLDMNILYFEIACLLVICYYSRNLWKNTSKEMLDEFTDRRLLFCWELIAWGTVLAGANKYRIEYQHLPLFDSNPLLFVIIGGLDCIAILILFKLLFKSWIVTAYITKDKE